MGRVYTQKFYKGTRIYERPANRPRIERIVKDEVDEKALQEEVQKDRPLRRGEVRFIIK